MTSPEELRLDVALGDAPESLLPWIAWATGDDPGRREDGLAALAHYVASLGEDELDVRLVQSPLEREFELAWLALSGVGSGHSHSRGGEV